MHNFRCAKTSSSEYHLQLGTWPNCTVLLACSQFNMSTHALHPPVIACLLACTNVILKDFCNEKYDSKSFEWENERKTGTETEIEGEGGREGGGEVGRRRE